MPEGTNLPGLCQSGGEVESGLVKALYAPGLSLSSVDYSQRGCLHEYVSNKEAGRHL